MNISLVLIMNVECVGDTTRSYQRHAHQIIEVALTEDLETDLGAEISRWIECSLADELEERQEFNMKFASNQERCVWKVSVQSFSHTFILSSIPV